MSAEFGN